MNSENCKISDFHRRLLYLLDKTNLKKSKKVAALSSLSRYYTWKNIKKDIQKQKLEISGS